MRHWLIKFAPFRTAWSDIVRAGSFTLRGIRSREARKHLAAMRIGDPVLFYHSQQERAVVGAMEVTREAYPDPTSSSTLWLTCDFVPVRPLLRFVTLNEIKNAAALKNLALVRQPRLAVMPVSLVEFISILALEENPEGAQSDS